MRELNFLPTHDAWGCVMMLLRKPGFKAFAADTRLLCRNDADKVACYTLGCPRVGNKLFVDRFHDNVPESWRIYNVRDSVAYIPRITGFVHVGEPVAFRRARGKPTLTKLAFSDPKLVSVVGVQSEPIEPAVCPPPYQCKLEGQSRIALFKRFRRGCREAEFGK